MSDLRKWLDEQTLGEELFTLRGRQFLIVEIDLAERSRLLAKYAGKKGLDNQMIEGLMCSRCVLDPETREPLVPCEEWEYWGKKGGAFGALVGRVLSVNGLKEDPVEDEVKNSDATTG